MVVSRHTEVGFIHPFSIITRNSQYLEFEIQVIFFNMTENSLWHGVHCCVSIEEDCGICLPVCLVYQAEVSRSTFLYYSTN